jgi:hypothetical protein
MIEAKSVKKRSVGRPKTNKALQKLRVQTWFNAVAEASGKTAYELEKEFAPSTVDRENFNKQRARLWEKYRLGKTLPTIKEKKGGKKGIALLVDERYAGTLGVLEDPIWILSNPTSQMTMDDLKTVYSALDPEIKSLLVKDGNLNQMIFWRKSAEDFNELLNTLSLNTSFDSFKALLCLIHESLISKEEGKFTSVLECLRKMSRNKKIKQQDPKLIKLIITLFENFIQT